MRRSFVFVVLVLLAMANRAHAGCMDGAVARCTVLGQVGTRQCVYGRWEECSIPEPEPEEPVTGTVRPKYYVLTVIYAPPGAKAGGSAGAVTYGSGSNVGTTTSATNSFKQEYEVSITGGSKDVKIGGLFKYAGNASRAGTIDIKKAENTSITARGPAVDGIHHNRDLIYLWLNPTVDLSLTSTSASWTFGSTATTADIQYVYVGWLQDPSLMPAGLSERLASYGITPADYPEILKADPFANGSSTIDPARFKILDTTFPYEPPFAPGDPVPTFQFNVTHSGTTSSSASVQNEYTVGLTAEFKADFLGALEATMKMQGKWIWADGSAVSASAGTSETATVTVGGPAHGYTGPTDMAVYYDVVNRTFLFAPVYGTVYSVQGTVYSGSATNVAGTEVVMIANGVRHRTFANARGQYRFPGTVSGPVQLQAGGVTTQLYAMGAAEEVDIDVP